MKILYLSFLCFLLASCRYGVVDQDKVYRAPQLNETQFQQAIDGYGIRTIINLRGENLEDKWYQEEKEVAEKNGVTLIDIRMSAKAIPHRSALIQLLDAFRDAPRPILIHCKAGADRTGEATALYALLYMNYSKKEALRFLSAKWGHVEKFKPAKKYFINSVWKGEDWARSSYFPCKENYKFYNKANPECSSQEQTQEKFTSEDDT